MKEPIISVNAIAFQGYDPSARVKALAELGIKYVEFDFIKGYSDGFSEDSFSSQSAKYLNDLIDSYGLKMAALAAHLDLGLPDLVDAFKRRMDFAALLGVSIILSNASTRANRANFLRNIEKLAAYAESLRLTIGLEIPLSVRRDKDFNPQKRRHHRVWRTSKRSSSNPTNIRLPPFATGTPDQTGKQGFLARRFRL
jgi:sugar phosphate isomerase/epimerase